MPLKILVVDDASFIRDMVKKNLRDSFHGAQIFDAVDGNRAVAVLKANPIDLILSDWEMPGMTGEELLHWVRSESSNPAVPFIMVTSRGDKGHVIKAVEAGVSDFISKPFTPDELVRKTTKQLVKHGKIDKQAASRPTGSTQGVAFASVDVLTGGKATPTVIKPKAKPASDSVAALTGGTLAGQKVVKKKPATSKEPISKGRAQVRFPNMTCPCVVRELSLQALSGVIQRQVTLPSVFEQAVIDLEMEGSGELARINGYVHTLQAIDNKPNCQMLKVVIRFVDNDVDKFEMLSRYVAKFNR